MALTHLGLVAVLAALSVPASAAAPATRLVECGAESCLIVSGRRADATSPVIINGHAVAARGERRWRVSLPVATVRAWSAPRARTIAVAVDGDAREVPLPIGLLSHDRQLAALEIRVK